MKVLKDLHVAALAAIPLTFLVAASAFGQTAKSAAPATSGAPTSSVQGFGLAGINWALSSKSFDAVGLGKQPIEAGGGAQFTHLRLRIQGAFTAWSDTGERAFIDSRGTAFPLGIPLTVKVKHLDFSAAWRFGKDSDRAVSFVGGGAGAVMYQESSPFADAGDNIDKTYASYHILAGAEAPLSRWIGIAGDVRYCFVPGILGDGGVSGVLHENSFNGVSLTFRLVVGRQARLNPAKPKEERAPLPAPPPMPESPHAPKQTAPQVPPEGPGGVAKLKPSMKRATVIAVQAPVFIKPNSTGSPIAVLPSGARLVVLQVLEGWLMVEFQDPQWGRRVGYVERGRVSAMEP